MKRYFRLVAAFVALAALLVPTVVVAQQTESRIMGRVLDDSKAAMPGVTITVTSKQTGAVRNSVSGGDGTYTITNLRPGTYTVLFELSGFATQSRDVLLGVGQVESIDMVMAVAQVQEAVTVTADSAVLDLSSAKIGVNVSPDEIETLPVNGRNFANLMTLATGATTDGNGGWASVRFNGKSNQQNYLNYDGVDGTYVWDASPGYLNSTGSQFRLQTSMESVAEFRVNSGLAPAESGLGAGGNITVVSKSGTNQMRGSLFEYRRDDALDSASKYRRQEAGARARSVRRFAGWPDCVEPHVLLRQLRSASPEDRPELHRSRAERRSPPSDSRRRARRFGSRPKRGPHAGSGAASERLPDRSDGGGGKPSSRTCHEHHDRPAGGEQPVAARRSPIQRFTVLLRALPLQRRRPRYARPDGHRRAASAPSSDRRTWCSTTSRSSAATS